MRQNKQDNQSKKRENMVTAATIKNRGWTESMIKLFLPEPDLFVTNPVYRSGPKMRLYLLSRVEEIEKTDAFLAAAANSEKRKKSARKAVDTKLKKLKQYIDNMDIKVPVIDLKKLFRKACQHHNHQKNQMQYSFPSIYADFIPANLKYSDENFLFRISVNYLRHQLTRYENELKKIVGKTGASEGYIEIKRKVLDAIAQAYPDLAEECQRQQEQIDI